MRVMPQKLLTITLVGLILLTTGCGEKGPGLIPVRGKVTYGGGAWPKAGKINFNPVEPAAGFPRLNGTADLATDGSFVVQSTGDKMGLVPGKYQVVIECWETLPSMETNQPGSSYLPGNFQQEVEIKVGEKSKDVSFDVPKKM
ncbi:MAG TPA: hypothetical protein VL096_02265 [Pirellulaceae bacterium]|nr:hypothetical protein [Pirellulaceae bacterium]